MKNVNKKNAHASTERSAPTLIDGGNNLVQFLSHEWIKHVDNSNQCACRGFRKEFIEIDPVPHECKNHELLLM